MSAKIHRNRLTHTHKYLLLFVRWGVKSTIKTKFQLEFARLVPYGPLTHTMRTLEFTAHAKDQERSRMRKRITDNQPENLCMQKLDSELVDWTMDWTMDCVFGLS